MSKIKSWEVSNEFWERVESLIPKRMRDKSKKYVRRKGGGRKPIHARKIFEAIVYVLRTGIQWKALPKQFGSSSSIHAYFQEWAHSGFFKKIWKKGLAEYDDMKGIGWEWQSIDGSMIKAPLAQESVGANPTDRGKKGNKKTYSCRRAWTPIVNRHNRSQSA